MGAGSTPTNPSRSERLKLTQRRMDRSQMCGFDSRVSRQEGNQRNRFRGREGEVVEDPPIGRGLPVFRSRGLQPDSQRLLGGRVLVFTQRSKVIGEDSFG